MAHLLVDKELSFHTTANVGVISRKNSEKESQQPSEDNHPRRYVNKAAAPTTLKLYESLSNRVG
jgi:hypothetical protein